MNDCLSIHNLSSLCKRTVWCKRLTPRSRFASPSSPRCGGFSAPHTTHPMLCCFLVVPCSLCWRAKKKGCETSSQPSNHTKKHILLYSLLTDGFEVSSVQRSPLYTTEPLKRRSPQTIPRIKKTTQTLNRYRHLLQRESPQNLREHPKEHSYEGCCSPPSFASLMLQADEYARGSNSAMYPLLQG